MIIDFGQGEIEAKVSAWTLVIYEQEFDGADMIQDLFGREVIREVEEDEGIIMAFDYRDMNWTNSIKALWAAVKCADDSVKPFKMWVKELGDIDLWKIMGEFLPEVNARLFLSGAGDPE